MPERKINYTALIDMAARRLSEEEYDCAVECCEYAVKHKRFLFEAHFIMGCALFSSKRVDEANDAFEKALRFRPASEECIFRLCACKIMRNAADAGILTRFAEMYPDNAGILMLDAIALYESGEKDKARAIFDKVHRMRPSMASCWADEGVLLLEDGMYSDAVKCFDKALELSRLNRFALYNRCRASLKQGDIKGAEADARCLMMIDGDDFGYVFISAEVEEEKGNYNKAEELYRRCLESNDMNITAQSRERLELMNSKKQKGVS